MARAKASAEPRIVAVERKSGAVSVRVDRRVYPIDAIYGAAYELLERAWVYLAGAGKHDVLVHLRPRRPGDDLETLAGELGARLLDHALRVRLAKQHGRLREMIVTQALAAAGAGAPPPPEHGPRPGEEDPFGVAEAWEQSRKQPPGRRKASR